MNELEVKRKQLSDLKRFARSEMARGLAKRHGRSMRLPWDPEEAGEPPQSPKAEFDEEALEELAKHGH